jgi:(2Fe-2S) ferredoxin
MSDPTSELAQAVAKHNIGHYHRHVFFCVGGKCATPEQGEQAWDALKRQIKQHGLESGANACYRTRVGCLRICCQGPVAVVYPEGTWYANLTIDRIPRFVQEHLVEGRPIEEWIFARNPLGQEDEKAG